MTFLMFCQLYLLSLSLLGWGTHGGFQWCQQSTSMLFQALRSFAKAQIMEEGGGGIFFDWLALQHICGVEFYIHQVLIYHVSGGTECI